MHSQLGFRPLGEGVNDILEQLDQFQFLLGRAIRWAHDIPEQPDFLP